MSFLFTTSLEKVLSHFRSYKIPKNMFMDPMLFVWRFLVKLKLPGPHLVAFTIFFRSISLQVPCRIIRLRDLRR